MAALPVSSEAMEGEEYDSDATDIISMSEEGSAEDGDQRGDVGCRTLVAGREDPGRPDSGRTAEQQDLWRPESRRTAEQQDPGRPESGRTAEQQDPGRRESGRTSEQQNQDLGEGSGNPEIVPTAEERTDAEEEEVQVVAEYLSQRARAPPQSSESENSSSSESEDSSNSSSESEESSDSSPEVLGEPPPSVLTLSTVPQGPSLPQEQQQPTQLRSEQTGVSTSRPEDPSPPVERGPFTLLEALNNLPAETGPSTSAAPLDSAPEKKHEDTAAAQTTQEREEEGYGCIICLEPCSNMGKHRLASLKCGHLFGLECITKWLEGTTNRRKGSCPQCNVASLKKDIRIIYAKNITLMDTSERERLQRDLQKERERKQRLELENAQMKLKYDLKNQEVIKLQKELKVLKSSVRSASSQAGLPPSQGQGASGSNSPRKHLVLREFMDICRTGDCRVMAHSTWLAMLVISMPSQVEMFPGFGIKKINLLELRVGQYVPLHKNQIRDLAFSPAKHDLLLSVGIDKLVKITNVCSNAAVAHFTAPAPTWCCCWSTTEANIFYVGTSSGHLHQYDIRHPDGPVATIKLPGVGPIVSMAYLHPGPESSLTWGGVLVARLHSCFFVEAGLPGEAKIHPLLLEGSFTSVSCEGRTSHLLVSCRPTPQHPHARHSVCILQQMSTAAEGGSSGDEGSRRMVAAFLVHTFQGGTTQRVLSRSLLADPLQPGASPLVYFADESTQSIYVWELTTMTCLDKVHLPGTVLDLLQLCVGQTPHLAALTTKGVQLYEWASRS